MAFSKDLEMEMLKGIATVAMTGNMVENTVHGLTFKPEYILIF